MNYSIKFLYNVKIFNINVDYFNKFYVLNNFFVTVLLVLNI